MVRICFCCIALLFFACKPSIKTEDIMGHWQGSFLTSEAGDTLIFQDDRRPDLELSDSTFYFQNRWGKKFEGHYKLDGDYILFMPTDSTSVANKIISFYPDSILVLRMSSDTTLLDLTFSKYNSTN